MPIKETWGKLKMNGKINIRKMILTPYGATLFPVLLLFISFIFPPSLYEHYVNEPNYMFLNFKMLAFGSYVYSFIISVFLFLIIGLFLILD
jgi:hypothetical protein